MNIIEKITVLPIIKKQVAVLKKHPLIKKVEYDEIKDFLEITTKNLNGTKEDGTNMKYKGKQLKIGRYKIILRHISTFKKRGEVGVGAESLDWLCRHESAAVLVDHPHIYAGKICMGNIATSVFKYIANGEFYFAFDLLIIFLQIFEEVDDANPYIAHTIYLANRFPKNKIKQLKSDGATFMAIQTEIAQRENQYMQQISNQIRQNYLDHLNERI